MNNIYMFDNQKNSNIAIQSTIALKCTLNYIRIQKCKIFTTMFLIYIVSILISFFTNQGYSTSGNNLEFQSNHQKFKISSDLFEIVDLLKSEEENKEQSNEFFAIAENHQNIYSHLNSWLFDLYQKTPFLNLNKPPKYLLYHQLKIYS